MKVVDASALVDLLLESPRGRRVDVAIGADDLAAPGLIYPEVLSALARQMRAGEIDQPRAGAAIGLLVVMPVDVPATRALTRRAWELRDRVQVAEAFYAACAEALGVPLVTCDGRLARAPLPGVTIIHVK